MLPLLALVLLNAAPANPPAPGPESFRKTKAFQDWSGGRFVFDERWVELPQAGLRVGYFLVPKAGSPAMEDPAFDDAFFVVDTRTANPVAEPVVRTKSLNGCPEPGEVPKLSAESTGANRAGVQFGNGSQRCALELRRTKDAWTLSVFPDEARSPEQNFPTAARAMAKVPGASTLQWSYQPSSRWLLAASGERCGLWVVDSITSAVNKTASEAMTKKICDCVQEVIGEEEGGLELGRVARTLSRTGPGTALPTCDCTFAKTGEAEVECRAYAGREYSVAIMAQLDEEFPERAAGFEMQEIQEDLQAYRELVTENRAALEAWQAGRQDEALVAWVGLYRKWITLGRPDQEDEFGEMTEEIVALRGQEMDVRHASIDQWAEVLNNLGFAMWSRKEWAQAEAAYDECASLLQRRGRTRNVLNLNQGDLYRDIGNVPAAKEAYQRFLSGGVTESQRKYVERELRKLEKR